MDNGKFIEIVDENGKKKRAKYVKAVKHHSNDLNGVDIVEEFVEALVVGKSGREWIEYYDMQKFRELNPKIKV